MASRIYLFLGRRDDGENVISGLKSKNAKWLTYKLFI